MRKAGPLVSHRPAAALRDAARGEGRPRSGLALPRGCSRRRASRGAGGDRTAGCAAGGGRPVLRDRRRCARRAARRVKDLRAVLETFESSPGGDVQATDELRAALARTGRVAERALAAHGAAEPGARHPGAQRLDPVSRRLPGGEPGLRAARRPRGAGQRVRPVLAGLLALASGGRAVRPRGPLRRPPTHPRSRTSSRTCSTCSPLAWRPEPASPQALELVVAEADDPTATEFARVLNATRLGATLVDGLRGHGRAARLARPALHGAGHRRAAADRGSARRGAAHRGGVHARPVRAQARPAGA